MLISRCFFGLGNNFNAAAFISWPALNLTLSTPVVQTNVTTELFLRHFPTAGLDAERFEKRKDGADGTFYDDIVALNSIASNFRKLNAVWNVSLGKHQGFSGNPNDTLIRAAAGSWRQYASQISDVRTPHQSGRNHRRRVQRCPDSRDSRLIVRRRRADRGRAC
jgi:hypothetical protein